LLVFLPLPYFAFEGVDVQNVGWENWSTQRKQIICRKSLNKLIKSSYIKYTIPLAEIKLGTLMVMPW
jgi:hypothetical protein